jgi:hypothetical protein
MPVELCSLGTELVHNILLVNIKINSRHHVLSSQYVFIERLSYRVRKSVTLFVTDDFISERN